MPFHEEPWEAFGSFVSCELLLPGVQLRNLCIAPRFQRGGAYVSLAGELSEELDHLLLARYVHDRHEVVLAHGIVIAHPPTQPLQEPVCVLNAFRRILQFTQAQLGPFTEYDIMVHFPLNPPPNSFLSARAIKTIYTAR